MNRNNRLFINHRCCHRGLGWLQRGSLLVMLLAMLGCASSRGNHEPTAAAEPRLTSETVLQSQVSADQPGLSGAQTPELFTTGVPLAERQLTMVNLPGPGSKIEQKSAELYSFHAIDIPIVDALRLFARDNSLNVILDKGLTGNVTVDFDDIPLDDAMDAILDAQGYSWEKQGRLLKVSKFTTRIFEVDYLRLSRAAGGKNSSGEFGMSESGGSGSSSVGKGTEFEIQQNDTLDFWTELQQQLQTIIGEDGSVVGNKTAGVFVVSSYKKKVDEVAQFLRSVRYGSLRQVTLEARIYELALDDTKRLGIDWKNLTSDIGKYGGVANLLTGASAFNNGVSNTNIVISSPGGERAVINALEEQGDLSIVSQPRITTLNNQSAQIKVATDTPFFVQTQAATVIGTGDNTREVPAQFEQRNVTLGLVLHVTPQISSDGWVAMDVSPVITRQVGRTAFPATSSEETDINPDSGPPIVDVRQTSVMVRARSGDTVVLGGLIQEEEEERVNSVPLLGDLPWVGGLFRSTDTEKIKKELVIFITPLVESVASEDW